MFLGLFEGYFVTVFGGCFFGLYIIRYETFSLKNIFSVLNLL